MPERIKFEINETTLDCLTPCLYMWDIEHKKVGSNGCGRCDYHQFQNYNGSNRSQKKEGEDFYVECTFKESQK